MIHNGSYDVQHVIVKLQ